MNEIREETIPLFSSCVRAYRTVRRGRSVDSPSSDCVLSPSYSSVFATSLALGGRSARSAVVSRDDRDGWSGINNRRVRHRLNRLSDVRLHYTTDHSPEVTRPPRFTLQWFGMDSHPVSIISQCGLHPGRDLIILGPRDKSDFLPTLLASASAGAGSPALLEGEPPP